MDRNRDIARFAVSVVTQLIVLLFLFHSSAAIGAPGSNGTIAYEFATMAAEPVGRSLAGAHLASVAGPASLAWNPAGLGASDHSEAMLSHCTWIADTQWQWGALSLRLPGSGGGLGVSCGMMRSGSLPGYTSEGTPTGSFSPLQAIGSIAYGRQVTDRWNIGLNFEGVLESAGGDERSMTWAFGGGIQWRGSSFDLGLTASHLAPEVGIDEERFPMPATLRLGSTIYTGYGLIFHTAIERISNQDPALLAGLEWSPVGGVATMTGLEFDSADASEEDIHLTFGLAIDVAGSRVAYSFRPGDQFAASHQISLGLSLTSRP